MKYFFDVEKQIGKNTSATAQLTYWGPKIDSLIYFHIGFSSACPIGTSFALLGNVFRILLSWSRKHDHAGIDFNITILGLEFMCGTYDHRHWDYENDIWEVQKRAMNGRKSLNLCSEIPLLGGEPQQCIPGQGIDMTPIKLSFWQKLKIFK